MPPVPETAPTRTLSRCLVPTNICALGFRQVFCSPWFEVEALRGAFYRQGIPSAACVRHAHIGVLLHEKNDRGKRQSNKECRKEAAATKEACFIDKTWKRLRQARGQQMVEALYCVRAE